MIIAADNSLAKLHVRRLKQGGYLVCLGRQHANQIAKLIDRTFLNWGA